MPGIPVLKPREVVSILLVPGFSKCASAARTSSFVTLMDARPRCRFTLAATFRRLRQIAKDIGLTVEELLKHR